MAEMSNAELQTLVVSQQQQLQALQAQSQRAVVDSAIGAALGTAGLELHPGAQAQLTELLRNDVTLVNHGGQLVPCGPGLKRVDEHVRDRLTSPEFSHFVRGGKTLPAAASGRPATPATPPTVAEMDQMTMGERVIAWTNASRPDHSRPASEDMSQSFGLPSSRRR